MFADFGWLDKVWKRRDRAKAELRRYASALEDAGLYAEAEKMLRVRRKLFGGEVKVPPEKERLE